MIETKACSWMIVDSMKDAIITLYPDKFSAWNQPAVGTPAIAVSVLGYNADHYLGKITVRDFVNHLKMCCAVDPLAGLSNEFIWMHSKGQAMEDFIKRELGILIDKSITTEIMNDVKLRTKKNSIAKLKDNF